MQTKRGCGRECFRRQRTNGRRRETYHIQCLIHEAMMNCSLRSLGRVLRLLFTLNRLNSWCQIDLIVKILFGLFLTDDMVI